MITFSRLDKTEKHIWLPQLFDLLYDNMRAIAPSGLPYEREKADWLAKVSPALDKEPREIILCFVNNSLAGYLQYYTSGELLVIEEVQLKKEYQRTLAFYRLCRHLIEEIPPDIAYIEAYADKRNLNSKRLMQKLGMEAVGEDGSFYVHFRGSAKRAGRFISLR